MLYIYVSHVEGIYVWGGVMARLHHDGNEVWFGVILYLGEFAIMSDKR